MDYVLGWGVVCYIRGDSWRCTRTIYHDDEGVAGSNKRISKGMYTFDSPLASWQFSITDSSSFPQAQNSEPISGLSSEGYKGKGHVQVK